MNSLPKFKTTALSLIIVGAAAISTQTLAHDTGYAVGSGGSVVMHAGGCVHSSVWKKDMAVPGCDGYDGDDDGDGVPNSADKCPGTPAGAKVNADGCEVMSDGDADGDGVPDSRDKCPGTAAHLSVDADGCPADAAPKLILGGVNFHFDSADLTADSSTVLDRVGASLSKHGSLMVEVAGHTDSAGPDSYNMGLSNRRANAVRDYLISQGVSGSNLTAVGYGESQPIADNGTSDGRAANRRVELHKR